MTVKNLFIFDAIVCLLFGLPLIFSPQVLANIFLVNPVLTDGAIAAFRSYGIVLSGAGIALLFARNALPSKARKALLIFIAISGTFTAINNLYGVVTGIGNSTEWGVIISTAIISVWAIILLLREKVSEV
jgi:hypothetical protein